MTKEEEITEGFWKWKFHWGRKLERYKWFRGWAIRHRADMSIRSVTWRLNIFGWRVNI